MPSSHTTRQHQQDPYNVHTDDGGAHLRLTDLNLVGARALTTNMRQVGDTKLQVTHVGREEEGRQSLVYDRVVFFSQCVLWGAELSR